MLNANTEKYDIEVELTILSPEEGGRDTGVWSGYTTHHFYLDNISWIARLDLQDHNQVLLYPGETAHVFITFFYKPHYLMGRLHSNKFFLLNDGVRTIGKGRILSILNFEEHAKEAKQQEEEQVKQQEEEGKIFKAFVPHLSARPYTHKKKQRKSK